MSDIPPEVIGDIFSHLPVKSLLQLRCISKSFRALIDSPTFIKLHLHHSLKSNSHSSILAIKDNNLYSMDFDFLDNFNLLCFHVTQVIGCCNGLACLLNKDGIYLANPSTKKLKKLPNSGVGLPWHCFHYEGSDYVKHGFGYDFVNDDYKVVAIGHFYKEIENEIRVYSLKSNLWRTIINFPDYLKFEGSSVLVNNKLHWVVTIDPLWNDKEISTEVEKAIIGSPDVCKIISFDLATEEYHLVPHPPHSMENYWMKVGELGGKLCVHCNEWKSYTDIYMMESYTDIYVMDRYGEKESWTKLLSLAEPVDIRQGEKFPKAVSYSKNEKEVLLEQDDGMLFWYDLKLKAVERIVVLQEEM